MRLVPPGDEVKLGGPLCCRRAQCSKHVQEGAPLSRCCRWNPERLERRRRGRRLLDRIEQLVGGSRADASALADAFRRIGAPFATLDLAGQAARDAYGYDLILVRPDLHVVWRGNVPPDNPQKLAALATGH